MWLRLTRPSVRPAEGPQHGPKILIDRLRSILPDPAQ
jgi:hypothetical protein